MKGFSKFMMLPLSLKTQLHHNDSHDISRLVSILDTGSRLPPLFLLTWEMR